MRLTDSISSIDGIGPKLSLALNDKKIFTVKDLLLNLPRKYEDYSHIVQIKNLKPGLVSIKGRLSNVTSRRGRRGLTITEALVSDDSASVRLVWFNQPYRQNSLKPQTDYYISGTYKLTRNQFSIINPAVELTDNLVINSARIVPIYSESKELNSATFRRSIARVIDLASKINDYLPNTLVKSLKLMPLSTAVKQIHFPDSLDTLNLAKRRFAFDDLFPYLLANSLSTQEIQKQKSLKINFNLNLAKSFVTKLPFQLTDDQRRTVWQIYQDMQNSISMNRLVEGDVGSGKTVVCVMSAVMVIANGNSVAFMAPTELLARQHEATIRNLLKPLGLEDKLFLLTGSMKQSKKNNVITQANSIENGFIIGTHSLLSSGIDWSRLALVIIDEQHRFGVEQRQQLQLQAGHLPHCLFVTATPIPRSLALTVLSDLKLSRIYSFPNQRRQIITKLINPSNINELYNSLEAELKAGRQAYIVCPYIHSSVKLNDVSLEKVYRQIQAKFAKYKIGIIYGQQASEEQTKTMAAFLGNQLNILVATSVIEVGVDVANASVIAVFGPDRFGLAQLHQLRGRVGRSNYRSYCYLVLSDSLEPSPRLKQFAKINNGFELSELDLQIRGPGAIYGKLQHGKGFSNFVSLEDTQLVKLTSQAVDYFINNRQQLLEYKELSQRVKNAQQLTYLN